MENIIWNIGSDNEFESYLNVSQFDAEKAYRETFESRSYKVFKMTFDKSFTLGDRGKKVKSVFSEDRVRAEAPANSWPTEVYLDNSKKLIDALTEMGENGDPFPSLKKISDETNIDIFSLVVLGEDLQNQGILTVNVASGTSSGWFDNEMEDWSLELY